MGPLRGIKVIEFAGLAAGPFCAMMLADMGADVVRIDRTPVPARGAEPDLFNAGRFGVTNRGRRSVALDLKKPGAVAATLRLIEGADALLEGFRPGVMERLGLGPEVCLQRNPKLVYGGITGWGQYGPLAQAAGHDINYIAISGALHAIGRPGQPPVAPLNLLGDFGGGAMLLAFGVVCALLEARSSGQGQVVDAAITDGAAQLMAMTYGLKAMGHWSNERGANLLDGGAPCYDTYLCADGRYVAIGPVEPRFYQLLLEKCGIDDPALQVQDDRPAWREQKERIAAVFQTRSRAEWCEALEGTDACFAPVLDLDEAPRHPHNRARQTFVEIEGVIQPAPAPRLSRTPPAVQEPPPVPGGDTAAVLAEFGFSEDESEQLKTDGAIQ